eukprot:PITA_36341
MPNGSLSSSLFQNTHSNDQTQNKVMDWKIHFSIVVGTARGILYLHEKCKDCIIHYDIKSENILLDANFCPKVGNFRLAKLLGKEYSKFLKTMRGTRGYLAPEWLSGLPITTNADVYNFSMKLFKIIVGWRNMDKGSESNAEQVRRATTVGGWCIQDEEDVRPSMSQVLQILEGITDVPPLPPLPLSLQNIALKPDSIICFFWKIEPSAHECNNNDNPSTTP